MSTQMDPNVGAVITTAKFESISIADLEEQLTRRDRSLEDQGRKIQSLETQLPEVHKQLAERLAKEANCKSAALCERSRSRMEVKTSKRVNVTLSDGDLKRLAGGICPGSNMHLKLQQVIYSRGGVTAMREVQSFIFGTLINYDKIDMLVFLRELDAEIRGTKADLPAIESRPLVMASEIDREIGSKIESQTIGDGIRGMTAVGGNISKKRKRATSSLAEACNVSAKQNLAVRETGDGAEWFQSSGIMDGKVDFDNYDLVDRFVEHMHECEDDEL